ncbi:MAG: hypothetical protein QOH87_327, partial [Trebonia sp.]|nr:hypothetical protein [Trebonia sp.]
PTTTRYQASERLRFLGRRLGAAGTGVVLGARGT